MSRILRDLRYALRLLRHAPGFAALATITLALGIGSSTAVFAFVNTIILRPTSVATLDDVYAVANVGRPPMRPNQAAPATPAAPVPPVRRLSMSEFRAFQARPPDTLVAVTAVTGGAVTIQIPGKALRVSAEAVASRYGDVIQVAAQAGRFLDTDDDMGALANVVVSDRLWRSWFGADRSVVGRATMTVGGRSMAIVGVAPRGFVGLLGASDVWLPLTTWRAIDDERIARDPARARETSARASLRDVFTGQIYARARHGVTDAAIAAAIDPLFAAMSPEPSNGPRVRVIALRELAEADANRVMGRAILGLAALVLLAACANLANLLYARGTRRAGEVAVRLALGGQPGDIFRLFLAETAVIAAAASILGLGLALAAMRVTGLAASSLRLPGRGRNALEFANTGIGADIETVLFAIAAGLIAAIVVGLLTAWRASRVPPNQTLAAAGVPAGVTPKGRRWRLALVAVQVTAALLLMMTTGVWVRQLADQLGTTVRFDTAGITAARIDLSLHEFTDTRGRAFYQELLERVRAIPGVDAAAIADGIPGHAYVSRGLFVISAEPRPTETISTTRRVSAAYAGVSEGFLDALGVRLVRGRPLLATDRYSAPLVAVVCESLANRLWPGEDAIGKRLMFGNDRQFRAVVGVTSDPIQSTKDAEFSCASCVAFIPWDQQYRAQMLVMVRSARPAALVGPLMSAIQGVDASVAIQEAAPLDETLLAWVRPMRAAGLLMASLGVLALVIASLGVYGVVSFLVAARTREFGIRLALGATPGRVLGMVLDQTLSLVLVGLLPGVLIATLGTQVLQNRVAGLLPNDIPTWIVVPLLVLAIGLVAGYVPARRAARIDPNRALREL